MKETNLMGKPMTILVNDSEGIPMEFETYQEAQNVAELFQSNSLTGNKYYPKQVL